MTAVPRLPALATFRFAALLLLAGMLLASGRAHAQSVLTTAPNSLALTVGTPFSQTYVGTGGTGQSYQLQGTLPPGLSFSTGAGVATISGTPTAVGSYAFTVTVIYTVTPPGFSTFTPPPTIVSYASPFAAAVSGFTVANPVALSVDYGVPATTNLANSVSASSPGISVALASSPANGSASLNGNQLTYAPNPGFTGTDTFSYVATAGGITSRPGTITVTVGTPADPGGQRGVKRMQDAKSAAVRRFQTAPLDAVHGRVAQVRGFWGDSRECRETAVWGSGLLGDGTTGSPSRDRSKYDSRMVSIGVDRCLDERFSAGLGLGLGHERSTFGDDPSSLSGNARTVSAYGSIRLLPRLTLDWLVGTGRVDMVYDRYVPERGDFARGQWAANQWLSSAAASYRFSFGDLRLSPFSRVDLATLQRDPYSETGAGPLALQYRSERLSTGRAILGFDSEYTYEGEFGKAVPRLRVEYQHDFSQRTQVGVSYVGAPPGFDFVLPAGNYDRRMLLMTLSGDIHWRNGLSLGFQLSHGRSNDGNGARTAQVRLSQKF